VADPKTTRAKNGGKNAALPFEDYLWKAATKLRGKVEEARYKDLVLGLVFLKFVSESFEHRREQVAVLVATPATDYFLNDEAQRVEALDDRDYYTEANVPWLPSEGRWDFLQANAAQANIGVLIDDAMTAIERENPTLRGVLPKVYGRYPQNLVGPLVNLFSEVVTKSEEGRSEDVLGRVYEFFLNRFGTNEGGQYYTPQQIVRLLVEMLEPYRGRVYDPCCGSGGMFVQSVDFVNRHGGRLGDVRVFGQEAVEETWRLAKMNLAIRRIDVDLGDGHADTFENDKHTDLRADFVLANPPFNQDDWSANTTREAHAWPYGTPPSGNGNYAWIQLFLNHLAPGGRAGFVLAKGSLDAEDEQGAIRRAIIEADLVECVVTLPTKLFATTKRGTTIPVCLWFLAKDRKLRNHQTLFIDAREIGAMSGRRLRVLGDEDLERVAGTFGKWRNGADGAYEDVPGFCATVSTAEIKRKGWTLVPGTYTGSVEHEETDNVTIEILLDEALVLLDENARLGEAASAALSRIR
jgi:type I restriction enzyme M protein